MTARGKPINLMPPSEFERSFWGRFLKWSITAGRRIIILTEMVVILAFLSRFKLDEDIRRASDEINIKRSALEAGFEFEKRFMGIKNQIATAKMMEKKKFNSAERIRQIAINVPLEVKLESTLVDKDGVKISGLAIDEKALGEMLSRLDSSVDWKSIELINLDAQAGKGVRFQLNVYK